MALRHARALRRVGAGIALSMGLASCWLTASLNDRGEAGSDAAMDAGSDVRTFDVARDTASDRGALGDVPDGEGSAPDASCTTATTYRASVLAEAPLAYFPLDEDGGLVARDLSGHGNDGTYTKTGVSYGQPGVAGGAGVLLNGSSGAIDVTGPSFDETSVFRGQAPYTVEAWVRPLAINSSFQGILSNELELEAGKEGYVVFIQDEAGVGFDRYQVGTSTPLSKLGVIQASGAYYHVVGVYEGEPGLAMSLYVNGAVVDQRTTTLSIQGGCTFAIGATHCGALGFFDGYVDEVAVYTHALTTACIGRHYALGKE